MSNPLIPNSPTLLITQINDQYLRQNFKNLASYFQVNNQLLGFKFFEQVFTKAQANVKIAHGLTTTPLDIITTQVTGPGTVTFNYGLFDGSNLNLTVSGACRVRFFAGTYFNFQSSTNSNKTDAQSFGGGTTGAASDNGTSVGDIRTSTLSLAQFQSQMGAGWVACDGSNVAGSAYATLVGNTVPNIPAVSLGLLNQAIGPMPGNQAIGVTNSYYTPSCSPGLKFTPTVSGIYRVYANVGHQWDGGAPIVGSHIIETTLKAKVLQEQGSYWYPNTTQTFSTLPIETSFYLTAGVQYQFDYQIYCYGSGAFITGNLWDNNAIFVDQVTELDQGINAFVRIN